MQHNGLAENTGFFEVLSQKTIIHSTFVELESQVAKIELGPERKAKSFVFVSAEKLQGGTDAESFIVAEILESKDGLRESCEQIALSIRSALRRAFKKNAEVESFEAAVALINEELGKLATLGETHWIDKLNCILGVKTGQVFNIATCGKVAAYLMRENELTDISCSAPKSHPLKTFENFASGKLRLGDLLILSTTQLFNHLSIDRLKAMLSQGDFLKSTGQIIELLKANAAPEIAFGTVLALQSEPGTAPAEEINLEEYIESKQPLKPSAFTPIKHFFVSLAFPNRTPRRTADNIISQSPKGRFKSLAATAKTAVAKTGGMFRAMAKGVQYGQQNLRPSQIKQFSPQKKFFFFSVVILLLALVLQITVAVYKKGRQANAARVSSFIATAQKNLGDADAALLYKDEPAARGFYASAMEALNSITDPNDQTVQTLANLKKQAEEIKSRLENSIEAQTQNLGSLAASETLISLPEYFASPSGQQIVAYSRQSVTVRDDTLKSPGKIVLSESVGKNTAVVYDGENLKIWNYAQNKVGENFFSSVPAAENAAGLKYYSTNSRVYMLDKAKSQILNFAVLGDKLGKPLVSAQLEQNSAKDAVDLAVDGSVYILYPSGIKKYHAGSQDSAFAPSNLITPLKNAKKIETETNFTNIYVLDAGNNRIAVFNKKGAYVYSLTSPEFSDLKDFSVDEKNKTVYILNGSSLLKANIP